MTRVFVYGTLKRGGENHRFIARQEFLGEATTLAQYRLYQLDGYPGLVEVAPGSGVAVRGEIWEVDDDCLRRLDLLEGLHVGLYRRQPAHLQAPQNHEGVVCYVYNRSVEGCKDLGTSFGPPPPPEPEPEPDPHDYDESEVED